MKQLLLFLLPCICACTQNHLYSEYKPVNNQKWKSTDTLHFVVDIEDTNTLSNMFISVRHQKNYEFSNLWVNIFTTYGDAKKTFKLEIPLFKDNGKPYGKSSGSLVTQTFPFQEGVLFPARGKYKVDIVQLMRKDPLDGIEDVGVIMDKK